MASSLQSSCTVLATKPHKNSGISPSPKPSQLLMNGRRSHRFQVSCSSSGNSNGGGSIDRRNMLLGLGGLYGASNLISSDPKAKADPVDAPDFNKCDPKGAVTGETHLDVNCCPPFSDTIIDYKLPLTLIPRKRRAAHLVDKTYIAKYKLAMQRMRDLDKTDPNDPRGFTQQANIHCAYCNGPHDQVGYPGVDIQVHFSWLFFPFHRWYLYFYERILGKLINDPTFALPFWNWDNAPGMQMPPMFDDSGSSLYDPVRNPLHRRPAVVDLSGTSTVTDPQQLIDDNLSLMYNEMVSGPTSVSDFVGLPIRAGGTPGGPGTSERGSHTGIHRWVGDPAQDFNENMGNFYSAGRDPMFYSHHTNVDRMWTIWNSLPADYSKQITDPDFLNASFLFYDENKKLVRVKVADCLEPKRMGYEYQTVPTPWLTYRPSTNETTADIQKISKGVPTPDKVLPLTLTKTARVLVKKTKKGKANEMLVLENIVTDHTQFIKFDVYINDEDDEPTAINKAEYAGTYSQLPHKTKSKEVANTIRFSLKELYENIDIADDDSVVVTIIPRVNGQDVTIGGINIIEGGR